MTRFHRLPRRALGVLVCVGLLVASDALAQGQRSTRVPQSPGRSGERIRPDNPRTPNGGPLQPELAVTASGDYRIDALVASATWSTSTITYSFYEDSVFLGSYYGTEAVTEVSEQVKTNVRAIMAWYGTLMNRTFVEVNEAAAGNPIGLIRIMRSSGPSYAYAYYPNSNPLGGDVHLNPAYDLQGTNTNYFQRPAGDHGYTTLIHEIGHALGLKHPHDGSPNLPSAEDNHTHTVMSYNFPGESPGSPMGYDIMALQYLYGARSYRIANDTYQFTGAAIDQYSLAGQVYISPSLLTKQVIWDRGGYNVLDLSGFAASASGYRLDLNSLGWLSTKANYLGTYLVGGTVIGPGVSVQGLINSGSSDDVYANPSANVFAGYASNRVTGTDVIYNATTQDTLDLSGYGPGEVFPEVIGNDLRLGLGPNSANGSVRLVGYYASPDNQPAIIYTTITPTVNVSGVTVTEANSSTTANFVVTLSAPVPTNQSVMFATADGSAVAGSDYQSVSTTVTFVAGETQKIVAVTILGDTAQEGIETFFVTLSSPTTGIELGNFQAVGTILNDDLPPNLPPVAVVSATPTSGLAPLTVNFTGSGSSDADGTIVSYAWTFGDGASSSATNPAHTYSAVGTYTAALTVTDNRGGTGSASIQIVVAQSPALVMHVGGISMVLVQSGNGVSAQATVTIVNSSGSPVQGATVTGNWTGLTKSSSSATTDANGRAVLTSRASRKKGTFTITVTGVTRSGSTYDASANVSTTKSIVVP